MTDEIDNDKEIVESGQPLGSNMPSKSIELPFTIDPASDTYVIKGGRGVAVAHVRKNSGETYTYRVKADGAFKQMTVFDAKKLSVQERRKLESDLNDDGLSQAEIGDMLGVSQPTVSYDLAQLKKKDSE
jgi:Fic family protein